MSIIQIYATHESQRYLGTFTCTVKMQRELTTSRVDYIRMKNIKKQFIGSGWYDLFKAGCDQIKLGLWN